MDCNKVIICTPIYKRKFEISEYNNLKISEAINPKFKKVFFAPYDLNVDYYKKNFKNYKIIRFGNHYFKNIKGYNQLLLSEHFYRKFIKFSHLILQQPDSIIIKDLTNLKIKNYDYIGSPCKYDLPNFGSFYEDKDFAYENNKLNFFSKLVKKTKRIIDIEFKILNFNINLINFYNYIKKYFKYLIIKKKNYNSIGLNGGLSIRRVKKFIEILKKTSNTKKIRAPEDHVYSYFVNIGKLKTPSYNELNKIFSEKKAFDVYGYHGLDVYDYNFLKKIHKDHLDNKII